MNQLHQASISETKRNTWWNNPYSFYKPPLHVKSNPFPREEQYTSESYHYAGISTMIAFILWNHERQNLQPLALFTLPLSPLPFIRCKSSLLRTFIPTLTNVRPHSCERSSPLLWTFIPTLMIVHPHCMNKVGTSRQTTKNPQVTDCLSLADYRKDSTMVTETYFSLVPNWYVTEGNHCKSCR